MQQGDQNHWENIYASKPDEKLSWLQPSPDLSLNLIREFAPPASSVIDIGGGSSALAGLLVEAGFVPCTVLDISSAALDRAKSRVDPSIQARIDWRAADILGEPDLPVVDVWHDRAVFHFLVEPEQRAAYIALARRTVASHGLIVLATFALDGPEKCSGLPVQRYDAASLAGQFAPDFQLMREAHEVHETPWGAKQSFIYVVLQRW
ncbi:MAG: class I SAM-dependent methyltransferase [Terracidiphilus sp.]|nr:class I SAM-dependent methyltransferase [Terracidiphilus sp.]